MTRDSVNYSSYSSRLTVRSSEQLQSMPHVFLDKCIQIYLKRAISIFDVSTNHFYLVFSFSFIPLKLILRCILCMLLQALRFR